MKMGYRLLVLMVLGLFSSIPQAMAATGFAITWSHATTRADGSALPDAERKQYTLYSKGMSGTTYTAVATAVGTATSLTYTPTTLPTTAGSWCFAMTTTDTAGGESVRSPDFCVAYTPVVVKPNPPSSLKATQSNQ